MQPSKATKATARQAALTTCKPFPVRCLNIYRRPVAVCAQASGLAVSINGNGNGHLSPASASAPAAPPSEPLQVVVAKAPEAKPALLPPPAAYEAVVAAGAAKAAMPAWKTLALGFLAGCYISFGGFMAVTAATMASGVGITNPILTRLIMGVVFPFGLLITLVCGAELYTGNTAFVTTALYEKKASARDLIKNWSMSYLGNFLGSLFMVAMVVSTGLLASSAVPANMAVAKTSIPWMQALTRGVLCNWLVCCAVWMAGAASSLPGKAIAAFLPVCAFITMGLEHSVANMFFVALGMAQGAPVSWSSFLANNLLPVTLGNTLAGVAAMATMYSLSFGALGKPKPAATA